MGMNMEILLYQEAQQQEDGTVLRPWVATLVRKNISAQGVSAKHVLRQIVAWVQSTLDEQDLRTPSLDAVRYYPPTNPEDPDWAPGAAQWEPYTSEEWEPPAWVKIVEEADAETKAVLVFRDPEPLYPDNAPEHVKDKFAVAEPYTGAGVPDGWDVRIWETV